MNCLRSFHSYFPIALALICIPAAVSADVGLLNQSQATSASGWIEIAPDGSGPRLDSLGLTVNLQVIDRFGRVVAGFPAQDIWLGDAAGGTQLSLCQAPLHASFDTDANGWTTIEGSLVGGGSCDAGL